MTDTNEIKNIIVDVQQANGEGRLVRKPIDPATGAEYETCRYALFPGSQLGAYEPELLIKLYDSLRFQMPDTAVAFMSCGTAAKEAGDEVLYKECLEGVRSAWEQLGRPTFIMACPQCMETLQTELPEIPTVSLYKMLIEMGISGGCNHTEFILWDDDEDVKTLAEDMGAAIQTGPEGGYPYITCSMTRRNKLKREGNDAVHILELIYGMGETNAHLVHEHDHEHCGGGHEHRGGEHEHRGGEHEHRGGEQRGDTATDHEIDNRLSESADNAADTESAGTVRLPDLEQRMRNRREVVQLMETLYWS